MHMVMEKLVTLLAEYVETDPSTITAETTFESLGIDSLDTVELVMELEEQLEMELELDEKIRTVGELAAFIAGKMGS